jgi:RimJ/RimL family protein N-acetyltransferase
MALSNATSTSRTRPGVHTSDARDEIYGSRYFRVSLPRTRNCRSVPSYRDLVLINQAGRSGDDILSNAEAPEGGSVQQMKDFSAAETLRDGRVFQIRALRPDDRSGLLAAVGRISERSLYRRFFGFKRDFTEREVDFFTNVDFVSHVALVALLEEAGQPMIVGGARYIIVPSGEAEIAFAVDDAHQGKGIGTALMRHLIVLAGQAGLKELIADVLPDNAAMLKVFETSGLEITTSREPDAIHVVLRLS